jgi:protoporphyrinogen oxidase
MKICVIGGGLCGLAAALILSKKDHVDLFEKEAYLGGCLASYPVEDYWIERYYHHCFEGDLHLLSLLKGLGIHDRLEWLKGTTGYYADQRIYPLNTPLEILRYPHLTLADKARLAWLTLSAKKIDIAALDSVPAREYILSSYGDSLYSSFFEPLLKSKFGDMRNDVSAAWLMSRIAIRSNRGLSGERLGYLRGGFQQLIDRLEETARQQSCTINRETPVKSVRRESGKWQVNGEPYDVVLSTIPPQALAEIGGPAMPTIPYQGAACLTLGLEQEIAEGIYWLNMKDSAPYGAVITHTNFVPYDRYGEHIVYLASYFAGQISPDRAGVMASDFCRRFGVKKDAVHWQRMAVDRYAGPVYTKGYRHLIPDYEAHGLFMAGMFSPPNYPERSMEGSIVAAHQAAERMYRER